MLKEFRFLKNFISFLIIFFAHNEIFAQSLGNSPYSKIGLGDLRLPILAHQQGMGGTGVSFTMPFFVNNLNPASLGRLSKVKNTIFEAGVNGQFKQLKEGEATQQDFGGGLDYLSIAFPVSNQMGANFGITSLSSVSFENNFTRSVTNSDFSYTETYQGGGGLTNLYVGLGFEPTKNFRADTLKYRFSFGLRANYIFGAITDNVVTKVQTNSQTDYFSARYNRTGYSDFTFEVSTLHSLKLKKEHKLNFGVNVAIPRDLNVKRYEVINRRNGLDPATNIDTTLLQDNQDAKIKFPMRISTGISIEKEYKWMVGADFSVQDWSSFQNVGVSDTLTQSYTLSLGGQFIPDFTSVAKGFWRRTMFKAGVSFTQTPTRIRGTSINDLSASIGASIPFGRGGAILNMALIGGKRGTLEKGLIQENYFRVHIGATINDRWFIKPKFN